MVHKFPNIPNGAKYAEYNVAAIANENGAPFMLNKRAK